MSSPKPVIAHLWADYLPNSFVEAHPRLLAGGEFDSLNIAATLWDNNERPDARTFYIRRQHLDQLLKPTLVHRVREKLLRAYLWRRFNDFCAEKLEQHQVGLAHAHFGTTAARLMPALERSRVPLLVTLYGVDASAALRDPGYADSYRRMYARAGRILVLCEAVKRRLADHGCDPAKVSVWNMPAGIEKYPYLPRHPGDITRFIISARFIEKKGHLYLLSAFERLLRKGRKIALTIIGYGSMKERLEAEVQSRGIAPHVTIIDTAARGDFATLYNETLKPQHIFVLPSTTAANGDDEGGPALTLVCAQAAGLPVICTPFPGSEITVTDNVSGLFCNENDVDSLAAKMEFLMDNPALWNELGRQGHEIVREGFSEQGQMGKLYDFYRELLR